MRRYVEWVIRHRLLVVVLTGLVTGLLVIQIKNLRVIIDPNNFLPPGHPYVVATDEVERRFGSKYVVVIGLTPAQGTVFQPHVLKKVQRITSALWDAPGVVKGNVLSLSARKAKDIVGTDEGMIVRPILEIVPEHTTELAALRASVHSNPAYIGTIVSPDDRTTAILAEFKDPGAAGFGAIIRAVAPIVERERDDRVAISVGGLPSFLTEFELNAQRMVFLFPLAVLITGFIHYEAFRTIQGLILPLVTALLAVVWALGVMGGAGVPMDVFNITTPILILAVAAGHAVQILKRYYEEYHRLRTESDLTPSDANRAAVAQAMARTGPVMLTAGIVAALSFLSLLVFKMGAVRTFGVFTGLGILSALVIELTLIPALRSWLRAPGGRERERERERRFWDRIVDRIASAVTGPHRRYAYAAIVALTIIAVLGASRVRVDETFKQIFFNSLPIVKDDALLNERLGGTNTLYLFVEGDRDGALRDPRVLQAMERTQQFLERQPSVGKTLSVADFIKRMNRATHADDSTWDRIPDSEELISQYLLLYSMSGDPGDFDTYVDYNYRSANVWVFLRTDSNAYFHDLVQTLEPFVRSEFPPGVRVTFGGSVAQATAVRDTVIESKLLNMVQIGAAVLGIATLVFRSFVGGLLVLAPLAAAVLANFGIMGWFGIPLNGPNSLTSAMAVGIGADYAIYLIYRIREEIARGATDVEAVRAALRTAGKAVMFVASAVAGGYAVLLLSYGFYWHIWMAILIASAMLVSALASLTIIPSLILTLRPRFVFGPAVDRGAAVRGASTGLVALLAVFLPAEAQAPSARDIMQRNFDVGKVPDSTSDSRFRLINKLGAERQRMTFSTTKLQPNGVDNRRMVRFVSPPEVKDTVILLLEHSERDDDIWIYLPALKKVRRLVASNKKDSFAGTDFTYGDVIGHKVDEWEHRILREENVDDAACYVIESTPRNDGVRDSSGYAKRLSWIRKDNFVQVKGEHWDRGGQLLKTTHFSDIRRIDPERGRWQAMHLEAANVQTGHRTVITFENFKVNQGVKDEFFTTRYMETDR